jgi:hypothetical protein
LVWRRAAAIEGDMVMVAGRRRVSEQWTQAGAPVFSYRFDALAVSVCKTIYRSLQLTTMTAYLMLVKHH